MALGPLGEFLQRGLAAIPKIRVTSIGVLVRVLPEALSGPAAGDGTDRSAVASQNQGVVLAERCAVTGASLPPVRGGVDHGVPASLGLVGLTEVLDPGDHVGLTDPVAFVARWIVFNVQHTGQGLAVVRPTSTMSEEVRGLGGTRATVRVGKVVTTSNQIGLARTFVVTRESLVGVGGAFRRLVWSV